MSHVFPTTPTALGGTLTLPDDGDTRKAASVNTPLEALGNAVDKLESEVLSGTGYANAHTLSFQQGPLYGLRHRATWIIADATPGTGSLDSGGSTATPTEPEYDEYLITGDLTGEDELHLQLNIVTANNANQTGRRIRIVRRTDELVGNIGEDIGEENRAYIVIEYLTNGASPVEVATLRLQPGDEWAGLGSGVGLCWGWVELTFVPVNLAWRCTAWGGAGRPVYA
jgi:hypothetical protein